MSNTMNEEGTCKTCIYENKLIGHRHNSVEGNIKPYSIVGYNCRWDPEVRENEVYRCNSYVSSNSRNGNPYATIGNGRTNL